MPISREKREKKIEQLITEFGSVRNFWEIFRIIDPQKVAEIRAKFLTAVENAYDEDAEKIVLKLAKELLNREKLLALAKQPGELNKHLKRFCGGMEKDLKALVNGKSRRGRPTQVQRDYEIARMYDEEDKTFGEIAIALKMNSASVEQAYRRFRRDDQKILREFFTGVVDLEETKLASKGLENT